MDSLSSLKQVSGYGVSLPADPLVTAIVKFDPNL